MSDILTKGEAEARLPAALLLSEMGPTVRALDVKDRSGFARSLTKELMSLAGYKDMGARLEALRALGNINADPEVVVPLFRNVIDEGDPKSRLVAAQALGQMIRVIKKLREHSLLSQKTTSVEATAQEVIHTAELIIPVCRLGLKDANPLVRAACLDAVSGAAQGLLDLIPDPIPLKKLPPRGRRLDADEVEKLLADYKKVRAEFLEVEPFVKVLHAISPSLLPALEDSDPELRLLALDALVSIAHVRFMQSRWLESVPLPSTAKDVKLIEQDDLLADFRMRGGFPVLFKLLGDTDLRIRQRVLDVIEHLEDDAEPAIPGLERALQDSVRSIRQAAAIILGILPNEKVKATAASLGKLLLDPDSDVSPGRCHRVETYGARRPSRHSFPGPGPGQRRRRNSRVRLQRHPRFGSGRRQGSGPATHQAPVSRG